mmetsp:Transcript_61927/g.133184  ORF Transcript_61927/g.133184 Transcript_61927/m.133184 type:complete len:218 (-) Transcript_61927:639-1292(-)
MCRRRLCSAWSGLTSRAVQTAAPSERIVPNLWTSTFCEGIGSWSPRDWPRGRICSNNWHGTWSSFCSSARPWGWRWVPTSTLCPRPSAGGPASWTTLSWSAWPPAAQAAACDAWTCVTCALRSGRWTPWRRGARGPREVADIGAWRHRSGPRSSASLMCCSSGLRRRGWHAGSKRPWVWRGMRTASTMARYWIPSSRSLTWSAFCILCGRLSRRAVG